MSINLQLIVVTPDASNTSDALPTVSLGGDNLVQSDYLYLQSVGSVALTDGGDSSTPGIQLRWDLRGNLGDNHLPKGDLTTLSDYATTTGFNKSDDYVKIYRAEYQKTFYAEADLNTPPTAVVETGDTREWHYTQTVNGINTSPATTTTIIIRFTDTNQYDQLRKQIDISTSPIPTIPSLRLQKQTLSESTLEIINESSEKTLLFLETYSGMLEVEAQDKLIFCANVFMEPLANTSGDTIVTSTGGFIKTETVSVTGTVLGSNPYPSDEIISSRKQYSNFNPGSVIGYWDNGGGTINTYAAAVAAGRAYTEITSVNNIELCCENIQYFRFIYNAAFPTKIRVETYQDFITGVNNQSGNQWYPVQDTINPSALDFSLSITDDNVVVQNRLDNNIINVNGNWQKYTGGTGGGQYTVNTSNYMDRWTSSDGLKEAVIQYLTLSKDPTNQLGTYALPASDGSGAYFDINYLDMIRLVAVDYHAARMLGLGFIDTGVVPITAPTVKKTFTKPVITVDPTAPHAAGNSGAPPIPPPVPSDAGATSNNTTKTPATLYIYAAHYITTAALEDGDTASNVTHLYLGLPTSMMDSRLPLSPVMEPCTYGLSVDNATPNPKTIGVTNPVNNTTGYSPYENIRFVGINRGPDSFDVPLGNFYQDDTEFCICDTTRSVLYGLEYKLDGASSWQKPELSDDPDYSDASGLPETVGILDQPNPLYVHFETQEGFHDYALYGINWFSRVSPLSNIMETDQTLFPIKETLLPPMNFAVLLVQEENPRILTTTKEQTSLAAITTDDKTYVRVTFDWNYIHNIAYQFADKVELFFRENLPTSIAGVVGSVVDNGASDNTITVSTSPFFISSTSPSQTITPYIAAADKGKFVGSLFNSGQQTYIITDITTFGANPTFVLQKIITTSSQDINNDNQFTTLETPVYPNSGDRFLVVENLSNPENWDSKLAKRISLVQFSTNDTINVIGSTNNANGFYTIENVSFNSTDTVIEVKETVITTLIPDGSIIYGKRMLIIANDPIAGTFTVAGNVTSEIFTGTDIIQISCSNENDGFYKYINAKSSGTNTVFTLPPYIASSPINGYLTFSKLVTIVGSSSSTNSFSVLGDITDELNNSYKEIKIDSQGNTKELVIGGIYGGATITERLDVYSPSSDPCFTSGDPIPNSHTGVYDITFDDNTVLPAHPDPTVDWYKGCVRILEDLQTDLDYDASGNILPSPGGGTGESGAIMQNDLWNISVAGLFAATAIPASHSLRANKDNPSQSFSDWDIITLTTPTVGTYDASGNVFPSSGGTCPLSGIKAGDLWNISVNGTLGGTDVTTANSIQALVKSPGQNPANWHIDVSGAPNVSQFNASGNSFPSGGGTGVSGAIKSGDTWTIAVGGLFGGTAVQPGYSIKANINSPASIADWTISSSPGVPTGGKYNAHGGVFPASGGSGPSGTILQGDIWEISVAGTLGGTVVVPGDSLRALSDGPAFDSSKWQIIKGGRNPLMKLLQVLDIKKDSDGVPLYPVQITVYDPQFKRVTPGIPSNNEGGDNYPIKTGSEVNVNFHPSYRTYLYADTNTVTDINGHVFNNDFDKDVILPAMGKGSKQTYIGARSIDSTQSGDFASSFTPPAVLYAREIVDPIPPATPLGPLFATRPNYYGKSTYTFDVQIAQTDQGRRPFSLIFYRANLNSVLVTLYQTSTVATILSAIAGLSDADAAFNNSRWNSLVNGEIDSAGTGFKTFGSYQLPIPDNGLTKIPDPNNPDQYIFPFRSITSLAGLQTVLNLAIQSTFIPLTEQPVVYQFVKGGFQTSGKKPIIRNTNGDLIVPVLPTDPSYNPDNYDPFPMAVQFSVAPSLAVYLPGNSNYNDNANAFYVRFTDYTLDGAADAIYFYYAVELSILLQMSGASGKFGPIQLVNAYSAEAPGIKSITTQLEDDTEGTSTAVNFEINDYVDSEGINQFQIYRAYTSDDALSTRTMQLAKTVDSVDELSDDFSDLNFIPYGEPLFYRIVALRQILNEQSQVEFIPSKASNLALTNIVDPFNPEAPVITATYTSLTAGQIDNVQLSWSRTVYNGTYSLYKMNSSGNWVSIYQIVRNNADTIVVNLADTSLGSNTLSILNDDKDQAVYHRFRVKVENSSGLLNLTDNELTIPVS